jgi:hypothetical protein
LYNIKGFHWDRIWRSKYKACITLSHQRIVTCDSPVLSLSMFVLQMIGHWPPLVRCCVYHPCRSEIIDGPSARLPKWGVEARWRTAAQSVTQISLRTMGSRSATTFVRFMRHRGSVHTLQHRTLLDTERRCLMHSLTVTDTARICDGRAGRPKRRGFGPRRHVIGSVVSHLRHRSVVRSGGDAQTSERVLAATAMHAILSRVTHN